MLNTTSTRIRGVSIALIFVVCDANAAEWSVEPRVTSNIQHNDNLFLTVQDPDSVSNLVVAPSIKMRMREKNWETSLNSTLSSNNYSDSDLDSNDIYFDLTGTYFTERNSYSLNGNLDFDSNLNSESTDFGIARSRVDREMRSISPQFTRSFTERLLFSTSYIHSDVDYENVENTGFVPYKTDSVSGSLSYDVSEKDRFTFLFRGTAYESKDGLSEYDSTTAQVGMAHELSESFSVDYLVGSTQVDSTNRSTQTFDFLGQPITLIQVVDSSDSGLSYDAGFSQKWLVSSLTGRLSRNDRGDSFGGVNKVESVRVEFNQNVTSLWNYGVSMRYEDIESINSANQFSDREIIFFESKINYNLSKDLTMNASYLYTRRKFESQTGGNAPDSNRIYIGITYNFPSISTF